MAFSMGAGGNTGFGMQPQAGGGDSQAQLGPELAEIQTQVSCAYKMPIDNIADAGFFLGSWLSIGCWGL